MNFHPLTGKVTYIHGTCHYLFYSWRGVEYILNGDFAQIGKTIFSKGVSKDGQSSWADEEGNFLSDKEISQIMRTYFHAGTYELTKKYLV